MLCLSLFEAGEAGALDSVYAAAAPSDPYPGAWSPT